MRSDFCCLDNGKPPGRFPFSHLADTVTFENYARVPSCLCRHVYRASASRPSSVARHNLADHSGVPSIICPGCTIAGVCFERKFRETSVKLQVFINKVSDTGDHAPRRTDITPLHNTENSALLITCSNIMTSSRPRMAGRKGTIYHHSREEI